MQTLLRQLIRDDAGQDLIEYALLAGFIALGSVAIITTLGGEVSDLFATVEQAVIDAQAAP